MPDYLNNHMETIMTTARNNTLAKLSVLTLTFALVLGIGASANAADTADQWTLWQTPYYDLTWAADEDFTAKSLREQGEVAKQNMVTAASNEQFVINPDSFKTLNDPFSMYEGFAMESFEVKNAREHMNNTASIEMANDMHNTGVHTRQDSNFEYVSHY
ncbi:hypothetical protein LJB93_02390 [Desulfovibrio sp. OttesenSCG-928-F07]|nr:hypothetical protein [Desulfovibrio sp. OttesenSCG-928-F07]